MKNKYLITVILPEIEKEFNIYIPNNKKVGTIKEKILIAINEITNNSFNKEISRIKLIDRATGKEYENNMCIKDTGIKNGSKIVII